MLHDVCEDCEGWDFDRLTSEGFSPTIVEALKSVTKREDGAEDYFDFVRRAMKNDIGRHVKRADLLDNLNILRIRSPTDRDFERLKRYHAAIQIIENEL